MNWSTKGWQGQPANEIEPAYLGNGVMGLRVGTNPFERGRLIFGGLWGHYAAEDVLRVVDVPAPFEFRINMGYPRLPHRVEPQSGQLDYLTATLTSTGEIIDPDGRKCSYQTKHWVSRALPSLAVMEISLTPGQNGRVEICSYVLREAAVASCSRAVAEAPARYGGLATTRIVWTAKGNTGLGAFSLSVREAPGAVALVSGNSFTDRMDSWSIRWENAKAGEDLHCLVYLSAASTAFHPQPEAQAVRMQRWAFTHEHQELRSAHEAAWQDVWQGRVLVHGNNEVQLALDGSLFHLFCSASPFSMGGIAPFGLSNDAYNGNIFWDCETWAWPPFVLLEPDTAKASLAFRVRGLESARKYAALYGYRGAMFPWQAAGLGEESSEVCALTGVLEHHITPDIAFAFWQYQVTNGDDEWLHNATWPVLRDVANWVCSRVVHTQRGCEIRHVIGPDENIDNVNNNAFTNMACRKVLQLAAACSQAVGIVPPALWSRVADQIVVPRDKKTNLILQQDGWTPAHRSKQADTLLAVYPFNIVRDEKDIRQIVDAHVPRDLEHSYTVAMGDQINAVAAARIGQRDLAALFFKRSWKPYWIDTWGMLKERARRKVGCFITGHGGVIQAVLMGFPGLQLDDPALAVHLAALPAGWDRITCRRVIVRGKAMQLEAKHGAKAVLTPLES